MFTRSMTKLIQSFTDKTVDDCVVYQIEHTTSICLKTHDLDDLWEKYLLLEENRTSFNLDSMMKDDVFKLWKTKGGKTPLKKRRYY